MNGVNICIHCERIYVSFKGMVDLLDMDNIICRKNNTLDEIPIEYCYHCLDMEWDSSKTYEFEHLLGRYMDENRTEDEFTDS